MSYILGILMLIAGIVGGLAFPDLDLRLSFLGHRSIITHSLLLSVFLFWLARKQKHLSLRLLVLGVNLALAIHLCFDLFPKAWTGFALIDIPVYGRTNPIFSWIWIAVSIVGCMYLALALVNNAFDVILVVSSMVVTFGFYAIQESVFGSALIALIVGTGIALVLPLGGNQQVNALGRKLMP